MFDIGFWELAVIGLVALLVLGPKRLPEAARTAGRWVRRVRGFIADVKQDLDRELQAEELAELRRLKEDLEQARQSITQSSKELTEGLTKTEQQVKAATDPDYLLKAIDDSVPGRDDHAPSETETPEAGDTPQTAESKPPATPTNTPDK